MMVPTIHSNGTSKKSLFEGYAKAYGTVNEAIKALAETGPNGRDFYPQGPDALEKAIDEHFGRMKKLTDVLDEIQTLSNTIYGQED